MNTNKFIINGIIASVISFVLGNLFYNFLFKTYFDANIYATDFTTVKWWAIIGSVLCWGFLYAYILEKAKVTTVAGGAIMAFTVAVIIQTSVDLGFYAVSVVYKDVNVIVVDVFLTACIASIMGAAIMLASNKKKA
jgi:hypothetical protein